jgi:hypothetical protein
VYEVNNERFVVIDAPRMKSVRSDNYNYDFNKETGFFARWGKNKDDDPKFSPIGPEIWDCEATTSCSGVSPRISPKEGHTKSIYGPCKFCYKSNNPKGVNLSFDNFKSMIDRMPHINKEIIYLELEDGQTIELDCLSTIKTDSGSIILAKDIKETDNILGFYKGSEYVSLE